MSIASTVATIVTELVAELMPSLISKAKDKLRERGIDITPEVEKRLALELEDLEVSCRAILDEFERAEARGLLKPLGGPGPWGKFDDDDGA